MALPPRQRRRDTPAQDREAQLAESRSAMQAAMGGTNMSTPAQDANARRQQTPAGQRAVNQQRIQTERDRADRIGQQSSPWNRLAPAATAVTTAVGAARDGGPPNLGEPITQREVEQNYASADRVRNFGGRVAGAVGTVASQLGRGTADGSGFTQQQIANAPQPGGGPGLMDRLRSADQAVTRFTRDVVGIQPLWGEGSGRATQSVPDGRGTNTPTRTVTPATPSTVNPSALQAAVQAGGSASDMGYYRVGDGPRVYVPGTQRSQGGISVVGDMGAANEQFALANQIRQQTIDRQRPGNQVTVLGGGGDTTTAGVDRRIDRLLSEYGRTSDLWEKAGIRSQIEQLQAMGDRAVTADSAAQDRYNNLALQQLRNQGSLATAQAQQEQGGMDPTDLYNLTRTQQLQQEMNRERYGLPAEPPAFDIDAYDALRMTSPDMAQSMLDNYQRQNAGYQLNSLLNAEQMDFGDAYESWLNGDLEGTPYDILFAQYAGTNYAAGGLVEGDIGPMLDAGSAIGMGAPSPAYDPVQVEYAQYAQGAQQIGVPAVPFEQFLAIKQQQIPRAPAPGQQGALGFAEGGMVPDPMDASGAMVMDPNPNAPTDSIPAVIDGTIPAKLDSGEFVIPQHAVMFHGIDKLQKLIAQAEQSNGTESGATPTATQSVRKPS